MNPETDRRVIIDVSRINRSKYDLKIVGQGGDVVRSYSGENLLDIQAILLVEAPNLRGEQSEEETGQSEKKPFTCEHDEFLEFLANQEG